MCEFRLTTHCPRLFQPMFDAPQAFNKQDTRTKAQKRIPSKRRTAKPIILCVHDREGKHSFSCCAASLSLTKGSHDGVRVRSDAAVGKYEEDCWTDVGVPICPPMGVEKSGRVVSVPPVHTRRVSMSRRYWQNATEGRRDQNFPICRWNFSIYWSQRTV